MVIMHGSRRSAHSFDVLLSQRMSMLPYDCFPSWVQRTVFISAPQLLYELVLDEWMSFSSLMYDVSPANTVPCSGHLTTAGVKCVTPRPMSGIGCRQM